MQSRIEASTISGLVKTASYAVRGPIAIKSLELAAQLSKGNANLPFDKIIACNVGNPHALGQKPLSFSRDVLSIVMNPSLKNRAVFADDVVQKADRYLSSIPGMGSYTDCQGIFTVREDISKFLEERDGYPSDPTDIFLTNGASEGVRYCMKTFLREYQSGFVDGILAPIPQYPLYSALASLLNGSLEPYYLDESKGWGCSLDNLKQSLADANAKGVSVRALVVINPGNPTGQVLEEANMRDIVTFCCENDICLLADEVYQENIYKEGAKFVSFRKVAHDMGMSKVYTPNSKGLQMISFHSTSKGFFGECGLRGGYFEIFGIPPEVKAELYKLASISLSPNTVGQVATGLMVQPPRDGDASYASYKAERDAILGSLKRRAQMLSAALNTLDGVHCNSIDGAMYAFPTITLPAKAIEAARAQNVEADAMYCMDLLTETGIVLVPGSGFLQVPGTYHLRSTILPPEDKIMDVVKLLGAFHKKFLAKYA